MEGDAHLDVEQIAALVFGTTAIQEPVQTRLRQHISACDACRKKYEAVLSKIREEQNFIASADAGNWDWEDMCRKIVADTKLPDDRSR